MGLNTMPVGVEGNALPDGVGMPTAEGIAGFPAGSTTLVLPRLLTAIQKDWPGSNAIPHGFTRLGSLWAAVPAVSETRLVCRKPLLLEICACMFPPPQLRNALIRQRVAKSTARSPFAGKRACSFILIRLCKPADGDSRIAREDHVAADK